MTAIFGPQPFVISTRKRSAALIGFLLLLVALPTVYFASSSTADAVLEGRQENRPLCPALDTSIRPSDIHLVPTLIQHQNWIDFPVPRQFAGYYAFCLDGRVLSSGGGVLDFHVGTARFHVATRSIDLYWLSGNLDGLRDPNRWELWLTCAPNFTCQ